ncbi:MAG: signal peptidase II [Alphaproteobacteria bacterium]|nr:signal peptidase II [Alphaproteobacteria bacterium]
MKTVIKYLSVIFGVVLLDQIAKSILLYLITGGVPFYGNAWSVVGFPYIMSHVTNWFNIVFTWNPGASFSVFRSFGEAYPIIIILATGALIGFLFYYMFRRAGAYEKLPLAFIIGGALGNLIDRVRFGAVVDFLDFHVGGWHWPAFNVADIFIVIGVGLFIINSIFRKK